MNNEYLKRIVRLSEIMTGSNIDAGFFTANTNLFYLTGRVFDGYLYVDAKNPEKPVVLLKRPSGISFEGFNVEPVRKPEQLDGVFSKYNFDFPKTIALETEEIPYSEFSRIEKIFTGAKIADINVIRLARMIKTPFEIEQIRISAKKQCELYNRIPSIYKRGMTDVQLMAAIEYSSKCNGNLGLMRTFGHRMEMDYGSLLCGENAGFPSPFDFALGGGGLHPSQPVGANGTEISEGMAVMVDVSSNINGYQSDCARTFSLGKLPEKAYEAHELSIKITEECKNRARVGTPCNELYNAAVKMVESAGMVDIFMGKASQAKFIGHGLGIEINELPVIAPRFETPLCEGMVIALEPKFIIDGAGAVGIENTYVMTSQGLVNLTECEEKILPLD